LFIPKTDPSSLCYAENRSVLYIGIFGIPAEVLKKFKRVKPLKEITAGRRCCAAPISGQSGSSAPPCWTLDVLNIVRRLVEERGSVTRSTLASNRSSCGSQSRAPSEFTTAETGQFL